MPLSSQSIKSKIFGSNNKKDLIEIIQNTLPKGSGRESVENIDQIHKFDLYQQQTSSFRAANAMACLKTDAGDTSLRNKSQSALASKKIGSGESKRSIVSNAQLSVVSQLTTEQINRITLSLNNDRDQRCKYLKIYQEDPSEQQQNQYLDDEQMQIADGVENIEKELPLVLQTSEEARQHIIHRNKKLFQQEAKQTQLEKIIFEIKNDSGNKDGSNEFDSADRQQYLGMHNQKTAQFRKNSASGDIRSNSILSSDKGIGNAYS